MWLCLRKLYYWIKLLRVTHWVKNLFIFAPLFFSGNLNNIVLFGQSLLAFGSFCLISSSMYCFNDVIDMEKDRLHPLKCHRPVASGSVSITEAYLLMIVCAFLGFCVAAMADVALPLFMVLLGYWLLNMVYCLWLKQTAIVDVSCISIGFVLRIMAGAIVTGIFVSQWLVIMTYLLALFLSLVKRYNDVLMGEEPFGQLRESICSYNRNFILIAITVVAAVMLVCYIMYTISEEVVARFGSCYVFMTSFWVLIAILRFIQVLIFSNNSFNPARIVLKDYFVWLCVVGWFVNFFLILY